MSKTYKARCCVIHNWAERVPPKRLSVSYDTAVGRNQRQVIIASAGPRCVYRMGDVFSRTGALDDRQLLRGDDCFGTE